MQTLAYPYRPQAKVIWRALLLFGFGGLYMAYTAATNDKGLILEGMIHLNQEQAAWVYWGVAVVCAAFVAVALTALIAGKKAGHEVKVTPEGVTAPTRLLGGAIIEVAFAEIQECKLHQIKKQRSLRIRHSDGLLAIPEANLPDATAFDAVCAAVAAGVQQARAKTSSS